jgi:hypothetical protein
MISAVEGFTRLRELNFCFTAEGLDLVMVRGQRPGGLEMTPTYAFALTPIIKSRTTIPEYGHGIRPPDDESSKKRLSISEDVRPLGKALVELNWTRKAFTISDPLDVEWCLVENLNSRDVLEAQALATG